MNPPVDVRPVRPPEGYVAVAIAGGRALALAGAAEWLAAVVGDGTSLHSWAASVPERSTFAGRGHVFAVPAPVVLQGTAGASKRWAVRHYIRGGAVAMHMGDQYLRVGRPRPFRELAASVWARSHQVRTPRVVASAMYIDGAFYRADIATEVVDGAVTLADRLHETDGERGWLLAMATAGDLIRGLADIGLYHVDLNARNILLGPDPGEDPWIIDLDRARVLGRPSRRAGDRMLDRLTRSIAKCGTPTGDVLGTREILAALGTRRESL